MKMLTKVSTAAIAAAGFVLLAAPSYGFDFSIVPMKGSHGGPPVFSGGGGTPGCFTIGSYCWMDGAVGASRLTGAGSTSSTTSITMTFVDDFSSGNTLTGNFTGTSQTMEHGKFTAEEAHLIATGQKFDPLDPFNGNSQPLYSNYIQAHDFTNESALNFPGFFNVVNASYGLVGSAKQGINWSQYPTENSLLQAANGSALISKAAGNDGVAIGSVVHGKIDYLATGLKGGSSVIYVGALNWSGPFTSTTTTGALNYGLPTTTLASYSDYPGSDPYYQAHFLAVPVDTADTGLAGTSFAAPVITAYAALIAQKFSASTPDLVTANSVTNLLLNTAQMQAGWTADKYGKGEACLACALSPITPLQ